MQNVIYISSAVLTWMHRDFTKYSFFSYCNLPVEDHAVVIIKRQISTEQREEQHPHTPHISLGVKHNLSSMFQWGFHSSVAVTHAPVNMITEP